MYLHCRTFADLEEDVEVDHEDAYPGDEIGALSDEGEHELDVVAGEDSFLPLRYETFELRKLERRRELIRGLCRDLLRLPLFLNFAIVIRMSSSRM